MRGRNSNELRHASLRPHGLAAGRLGLALRSTRTTAAGARSAAITSSSRRRRRRVDERGALTAASGCASGARRRATARAPEWSLALADRLPSRPRARSKIALRRTVAPAAEAPRVLVEYGDLEGARWIGTVPARPRAYAHDSMRHRARPRRRGLVVDSVGTARRRAASPTAAPSSPSTDSATSRRSLNWVQAGRTASREFLVRHGTRRAPRARRGVYASRRSPPTSMVAGPSTARPSAASTRAADGSWIVQDMPSSYKGLVRARTSS